MGGGGLWGENSNWKIFDAPAGGGPSWRSLLLAAAPGCIRIAGKIMVKKGANERHDGQLKNEKGVGAPINMEST